MKWKKQLNYVSNGGGHNKTPQNTRDYWREELIRLTSSGHSKNAAAVLIAKQDPSWKPETIRKTKI